MMEILTGERFRLQTKEKKALRGAPNNSHKLVQYNTSKVEGCSGITNET